MYSSLNSFQSEIHFKVLILNYKMGIMLDYPGFPQTQIKLPDCHTGAKNGTTLIANFKTGQKYKPKSNVNRFQHSRMKIALTKVSRLEKLWSGGKGVILAYSSSLHKLHTYLHIHIPVQFLNYDFYHNVIYLEINDA